MEKQQIIEVLTAVFLAVGGILVNKIYIIAKTSKVNIANHRLFTSLHQAKIEIGNWIVPENREIIRQMLLVKIDAWLIKGVEFAKYLDKNAWKMNKRLLKTEIDTWTMSVIDAYTQSWRNDKIHQNLISKINTNHQSKIDFFVQYIQEAVYSDIYITNKLKVNSVFDILATLLAETKNDFLDLIFMKEFNGDLKGVEFNGIPINDKEYKLYLETKKNE